MCWRTCTGGASKATIWRVVTGADTAALDAVTGIWLMERASAAGDLASAGHGGDDDAPLIPVRVDGKTVWAPGMRMAARCTCWPPWPACAGVVAAQTEIRTTSPACSTPFPGMTSRLPTPPQAAAAATATAGSKPAPSRVTDTPRRPAVPHVNQAYLIERHLTALDATPVTDVAALVPSFALGGQ